MAQSYVGKRPISKGIGRGIRRFVIVLSRSPLMGVRGERLHDATEGCDRRGYLPKVARRLHVMLRLLGSDKAEQPDQTAIV
jgi:hypothetical protein